jgi:hypothetical protein
MGSGGSSFTGERIFLRKVLIMICLSGVERLGHEGRKDMGNMGGWARQVEEEMRPAIDRFGKEVGGLVTGLMDTIVDSPLFEHAIMSRADGSAIISGDHSIVLADKEDNLSIPSSEPGFIGHMERFGSHMERFGGHMGSELAGFPLQSFDPFSIFGMVRKKWYQGENVCTEREVVEEEDVPESINMNNNGFGVFQMNMQVR